MNSVHLIGRIANDPHEVATTTDTKIVKFNIAVQRRKRDEADFFQVVTFNKLAELIMQYMQKGKRIAIMGELHQHRFERDGEPQSYVEITAQTVEFLDKVERHEPEPEDDVF
jgi:single-strand DNA-binding protein